MCQLVRAKADRGFPAFTRNTQTVPEFLALNMIFLYLTGYNTEKEIKNPHRCVEKVMLCNFNFGIFFNPLAEEYAWTYCILSSCTFM